jgi:hypothetical protein
MALASTPSTPASNVDAVYGVQPHDEAPAAKSVLVKNRAPGANMPANRSASSRASASGMSGALWAKSRARTAAVNDTALPRSIFRH